MTSQRYINRYGFVFDTEKKRVVSVDEIIHLLNKYEENEFEKYVNHGW